MASGEAALRSARTATRLRERGFGVIDDALEGGGGTLAEYTKGRKERLWLLLLCSYAPDAQCDVLNIK